MNISKNVKMHDNRDAIDFANEPVGRLFRRMIAPTLISMVSMVILNLTDGAFIGHGAGSDALAAINISATLVTAEATPAAQSLYGFLRENFGKRTISGMMTGSMDGTAGVSIKTHEDIAAVYNASGRYPALVGFDFMNSTGRQIDGNDQWYKTYANKVISLAMDTWNNGGIPDFTWHWRDPSRETNEFYTKKVTFDFTQAFNADGTWNTSSTLYKNIIKDIDIVAGYFLQLQQLNIACIFRPLHEAPGGWFWRGTNQPFLISLIFSFLHDNISQIGYILCTSLCIFQRYRLQRYIILI